MSHRSYTPEFKDEAVADGTESLSTENLGCPQRIRHVPISGDF